MRKNSLSALSIAFFTLLAPLAGCGSPPEKHAPYYCNTGDEEPCYHVYYCNGPTDTLMLCNGPLGDRNRTTCQLDEASAQAFCEEECARAAKQNGQTVDCSTASVEEALVGTDQSECYSELYYANQAFSYEPEKVCEGGVVPPPVMPPTPPIPTIWCHGTEESTNPPGVADVDFDERALSYWTETWESGSWHYTASTIPFNGGCGYQLISIEEPDADEACRTWCYAAMDYYDGASMANEGYDDDVRILHHNCESFVAGTLCTSGLPDGVPVAPPLLGPVSTSMSLLATVTTGSGTSSSALAGGLAYSTYACPPSAASCPIRIHSLSFSAALPISGSLPSATGPATPFTVDDLAISMLIPVAANLDSATGAFTLAASAVRVGVSGDFRSGTTGAPAPFRIESDNPREITGSLESDGSILLSGSMDIAPGVTISF